MFGLVLGRTAHGTSFLLHFWCCTLLVLLRYWQRLLPLAAGDVDGFGGFRSLHFQKAECTCLWNSWFLSLGHRMVRWVAERCMRLSGLCVYLLVMWITNHAGMDCTFDCFSSLVAFLLRVYPLWRIDSIDQVAVTRPERLVCVCACHPPLGLASIPSSSCPSVRLWSTSTTVPSDLTPRGDGRERRHALVWFGFLSFFLSFDPFLPSAATLWILLLEGMEGRHRPLPPSMGWDGMGWIPPPCTPGLDGPTHPVPHPDEPDVVPFRNRIQPRERKGEDGRRPRTFGRYEPRRLYGLKQSPCRPASSPAHMLHSSSTTTMFQ